MARADDAPPYFVILITAHLVIGTQVMTDVWLDLPVAIEAAIFLPLTLALCLGLLRPVKGATLIGNGPEALKYVSMVGNDLALDEGIGTCGKAGQSVPVGVGMPTIKLDRMTVGGTGQ